MPVKQKPLLFSNMMSHITILDAWVCSYLTKPIIGLDLAVAVEKVLRA